MPEKVIGSIYPAALIGRTPLFGNVYMPYRLIFTTERVIAFYPQAKKTFRSGLKLFKAYEYSASKWKKLMVESASGSIVSYDTSQVSDEMLKTASQDSYGSLEYSKIGGVLMRAGADRDEFNLLFRPAEDKVLIRGLEFCTAASAITQVKELIGKTPLSQKVETEI